MSTKGKHHQILSLIYYSFLYLHSIEKYTSVALSNNTIEIEANIRKFQISFLGINLQNKRILSCRKWIQSIVLIWTMCSFNWSTSLFNKKWCVFILILNFAQDLNIPFVKYFLQRQNARLVNSILFLWCNFIKLYFFSLWFQLQTKM